MYRVLCRVRLLSDTLRALTPAAPPPVQGDASEDGAIEPMYRHPADEQPQLMPLTPMSNKIRNAVVARLEQPLNHGLIQWYRSGHDFISEHADKSLDIARGTNIVNVSIGSVLWKWPAHDSKIMVCRI